MLSSAACLLLAACNPADPADPMDPEGDADTDADADTDTDTDTDADPISYTSLRVAHFSPDTPPVDIYLDTMAEPAITDLGFNEGSAYVTFPAGTYDIAITPAGEAREDALMVVEDLELPALGLTTAAAFGARDDLDVTALMDEVDDIPADTTRLQITHAAVNMPQVDIWDLDSDTMLVDDVDFGATASVEIPMATATIGFDLDDDGSTEVSFALKELGEQLVNVFAVGVGDRVWLATQTEDSDIAQVDPRMASLRLMHLSPDAPPVDIYLDNQPEPAFQSVPFSQGTTYIELWAGDYDVAITPEGARPDQAVIEVPALMLDADKAYTTAAIDYLGDISLMALEDDSDAISEGQIRLQMAHTAPDMPPVDVWNLRTGTMLADDFVFGDSGTLELPSNSYELGFDTNDDGVPELTFSLPYMSPDQQVNLFAVNDDRGPFLLAQFEDGDTERVDATPR